MVYFRADEMPFDNKVSRKDANAIGSGLFLFRANKTLYDMQCMMDVNGATDLVIDLIMADPSPNVFLECIQLAISLLEGGNGSVQVRRHAFLGLFFVEFFLILNFKHSQVFQTIKG